MITITESAKRQLKAVMLKRGEGKMVHLAITGRGPEGFEYQFKLLDEGQAHPDDHRVDGEGFTLFLDHDSFDLLEGATLDYYGLGSRGSFRVDNPQQIWQDPMAQAVHDLIVERINPGIAAHGGFVTLQDVQGKDIYIEFGGGCMGCGASEVTLKLGIEKMIREEIPEVGQIIDVTNHAEGENPYYAPDADGESPLA